MTSASLLTRLDAHDRALFARWANGMEFRADIGRLNAHRLWCGLTHLGGARITIGLTLFPLLVGGVIAHAAMNGLLILATSHLIVHMVKRTVNRPRPRLGEGWMSAIHAPDQFSFPSGHSAAALSVAIGYAFAFPIFAVPLFIIAIAVGASRVYLGVHYPGDVLMGQLIALVVGAGVLTV